MSPVDQVRSKSDDRSRWMAPACLAAPAGLLILIFVALPLIRLARVSLYPPGQSILHASGLSVGNYAKALGDPFYRGVLAQTLLYGVVVTVVTLLLGFPIGYSLARTEGRGKAWRMGLVVLPLTLSLVVNVFGWLVILGRAGLVNRVLVGVGLVESPVKLLYNRWAVLLVMTQIFLPFQILSVMSVVANIDPALEEAAANLRARWWTTLWRVLVPLAWPGIVAGSTLVFILTITAFVTPRLVGGIGVHMVGTIVYEQIITVLAWPFGAAMAFVLLALSLIGVLIANRSLQTRFFRNR